MEKEKKGIIKQVKVYNLTSPRSNKEVPNQFEIQTPDGTYFQSYRTIIAFRGADKVYLDRDSWNYSTTTSKYRNQFLGETTKETKQKIKSGEYILTNLN